MLSVASPVQAQSIDSVGRIYALSGSIPIFRSPDAKSKVVDTIENGQKVDLQTAQGDWLSIASDEHPTGWIYRPSVVFSPEHDFINPGTCELIVAARKTLPEILDYIQSIPTKKFVNIFAAQNGWFTISVGSLKPNEVSVVLKNWKASGRIPEDSYCSKGEKFIAEINWHSLEATAKVHFPEQAKPTDSGVSDLSADKTHAEVPDQKEIAAPIITKANVKGRTIRGVVGFDAGLDSDSFQMPGFVSAINAAISMADFGSFIEDPVTLLGAAETIKTLTLDEPSGVVSDAPLPSMDKIPDAHLPKSRATSDPEARGIAEDILKKARDLALANDQDELLKLVDQLETAEPTGVIERYKMQVKPKSAKAITSQFFANEVAEVGLYGDGYSDLDLIVEDSNGNKICRSTGQTDREFCHWIPAETGIFKIVIANLGAVHDDAIVYVQ